MRVQGVLRYEAQHETANKKAGHHTRERQPLGGSTKLNQVRALDFMRDTLYHGRPFRTLNVINECNREALRIECGTSIPSAMLVSTMNQLTEVYGTPQAIRMDNGPEMT